MRESARIFISRSGEQAIVVTMHVNEAGICFEDEAPVTLHGPLAPAELGNRVHGAMAATSRREKDLSLTKRTDWPAFKQSGISSVAQFQRAFIQIGIQSVNDSNLIVEVAGLPDADSELQVVAHASATAPAKIGDAIIRVYEACRDRRV